mmetsp:Transcript_10145/g.24822  ORF Transcript_10145/g.24822 Transcript_10145/m.24822 type:complete len:283 (-) Transcript_10145:124-972(-)
MPKKLDAPEENPGTRKLIGVFTAPPPGCIGEPFNDKRIVDPRHKGKGIASGRYRADGRTEVCAPGTFKLSPFLFANEDMKGKDPYKTNIRYKDVFKDGDRRPKGAPKNGFGSADFPKRDEFSNTIRTEQLREILKKEGRALKTANASANERMSTQGKSRPVTAHPSGGEGNMLKVPLFDVVHRVPEPSFKLRRDDRQGKYFFMAWRERERRTNAGEDVAEDILRVTSPAGVATSKAPKASTGSVWVSIKLGNGDQMQVMVDEHRVVGRRPMSAHVSRAGIVL